MMGAPCAGLALERGAGERWRSAPGGGGAWKRVPWSHVLLLQLEFGPSILLYSSGVPFSTTLRACPFMPPPGADFIWPLE